MTRAKFSSDLKELRSVLAQQLPVLEADPDWYGSIYFERKTTKNYMVNLKQTQLSDQASMGAVFRIYDGYTLFEQATDDLDPAALKDFVAKFAKRVKATRPSTGAVKRAYKPATWQDRLKSPLEKEITSQLPARIDAGSEVHFGIRMEQDPAGATSADFLQRLKHVLDRCKALAPEAGLQPGELTFALSRQGFAREEAVFIDRETNMSQTLYRHSLTIVTMSGSDRTFVRLGGLGGLEAVNVADSEIRQILKDLKSLKSASRLNPGKYRVLIGPVLSGVLAHEAFGHSQEADTCARGRSKAWDLHKSGENVGNQHATILNNPALFDNGGDGYAAWGSYFFDEEGWLAHEQVLLDQGVLKAPMTNLTSAIRLGVPRTANGKRESWANGVYSRQTNTYFSAGDRTLDQLMGDLGDGFVALQPAGGMEDPKGMGIQVGISFLEEVKSGKRTGKLYRGPAGGDIQMTGYTPDILNSIIAKSKIDADTGAPDRGKHPHNDVGGCGKYHKELVYAGCGGPYMLLEGVTLG